MADESRKENLVAAYKSVLQAALDRRPSGTRQRIAEVLGKHKSFVSQIANPAYAVPIPSEHIAAIMELCHFSPEERRTFLDAYVEAHPNRSQLIKPRGKAGLTHTLHISVPAFANAEKQREVEETIRQLAARIIALARED